MKFKNEIVLENRSCGILIKQFDDAYLARNWQLTNQVIQLVQTANENGLRWMIREGHPQANARWPCGRGRVYLAFSPTRENHWSMAIDTFRKSSGDYGHAVFNGKYHRQFVQHNVPFEFEKRNRGAGHMVVARDHVLTTLSLSLRLDHRVLYLGRSNRTTEGFSTEYDIQRALLFDWDSTVFSERYGVITDEFPVDFGQNPRRIDILCKDKDSDERLVIEIKRAEANPDAIRQIRDYLHALSRREDFREMTLKGVLVAERVPLAVRQEAKRYGISAYELSYPLEFKRVA